jgi:acyl transferase domain-containing protein/NADPH:quinone reductase-like Zn-dependent oxidoreductase/short-subunit dehydrogenase
MSGFSEPLAIVGVACRFPGPAYNLEDFWRVLATGADAVTGIPPGRFSLDRFFSAADQFIGHAYTTAAGVLPDILDFDPEFFGISRTEALDMDPQQRLVLEMTWEALENAGIIPSSLRGSDTGVYMGVAGTDAGMRNVDDLAAGSPYTMTGGTLSLVANRVSWFFDLRGPSLSIDTACSSSLVALHLACEALRRGEISLAVVGGVNCLFSPYPFAGFSRARMLSPEGRCKVFDASADGYVRSEGGGVALVTTRAHARRKKFDSLAWIAGTGVNAGGRTIGISLPNPESQAALIRQVYARFGLDPRKVVYVEAHGTGTAAGDPPEVAAIGNALGKALSGVRQLPVGSVKSNIGHLETAAGMAGLIKALLVLRHGAIPPNLHLLVPNPAIDFTGANIMVPTAMTALPVAGGGELVSVNSFGFGGANAHVVLQGAERQKRPARPRFAQKISPLLLSARSRSSLRNLAGACADALEGMDAADVYDFAATLALRREHLELRSAVRAPDRESLRARLRAVAESGETGNTRAVAGALQGEGSGLFAFSGNGSQWSGMGRQLLKNDRVFRRSVEETDSLLAPLQGWSIQDAIRRPEDHAEDFTRTEKSQPLIFAMQVGLVRVLEAKGLVPAAVIGHSVGEVAAAWCAGALSLADAALVIHIRSVLQAPLCGSGGMAAANMTEEQAREMLVTFGGEVDVAAVNTPASLSLAGETEPLRRFVAMCRKKRIAAKLLPIAYPFHTRFMDGIQEELGDALAGIQPGAPRMSFFSTVRGGLLSSGGFDAAYWRENVRRPVLFASAFQAALDHGCRLSMEIGPSPVLYSYMRAMLRKFPEASFAGFALPGRGNEADALDAAWAAAWEHGWKLDLRRIFPRRPGPAPLPAYPWNRERCWREDSPECRGYLQPSRVHPLLGWQLPGRAPIFENMLHLADFRWLEDHVVGERILYPATAFLESMLAAGRFLFPEQAVALERVVIPRPLQLAPDAPSVLRLSVDREDGGVTLEARPYRSAEDWTLHARGRIAPSVVAPGEKTFAVEAPESFGREADTQSLYAAARRFRFHYGPAFRLVKRAWTRTVAGNSEVLAELDAPLPESAEGMHTSPAAADGAFHLLFLLLNEGDIRTGGAYLPAFFERVTLLAAGCPRFAHARLDKTGSRSILATFRLLDGEGNLLLLLQGCRFRTVAAVGRHASSSPHTMLFLPLPHPDDLRMPEGITPRRLAEEARKAWARSAAPDAAEDPRLLLRLAALAAARESVLALGLQPEWDFSCEELLACGRLDPDQELWLRSLLEYLEKASFAIRSGDVWRIPAQDKRSDAEILWRTALAATPGHVGEAALLAHVASSGGAVLRGEFAGREEAVLPASLSAAAYLDNAASLRPAAEAVARALRAALKAIPPEESLHILQFAEQPLSSLLSPLAPLLENSLCRYSVALEDEAAVEAAAVRFSHIPAIRFIRLSFDDPQTFRARRYHILVLPWWLHRRPDIASTLERCRDLLAPGGILLLLEQRPGPFADYVFGARPSWWRLSPAGGKPVSLLREAAFWERVLRDAGFTDVESPCPEDDAAFLLLARNGGLPAWSATGVYGGLGHAAPDPAPVRPWLVVGAAEGSAGADLASLLSQALAERGDEVFSLLQGDPVEGVAFDPEDPEHWKRLAVGRKGGTPRLVYCAGYDNREDVSLEDLSAVQAGGVAGLAALAGCAEFAGPGSELWILAGGAVGGPFPGARPVPSQGALLGCARVLGNELRAGRVFFIDLHAANPESLIPALLRELPAPALESEIILTPRLRFAPRLTRLPSAPAGTAAGAQLRFDQPGQPRNLHWAPAAAPAPGPGELRVAVTHAGLNFRDVMWSMGLLPDEALENGFCGVGLGMECAGVVDAVGSDVAGWSEGDEVMCFAPSCLGSHVLTPASAVAARPAGISPAEAATVPVAFMTAWYALRHLARLRRGERVLIHGAAGGVGLAAIQIAAHLGLEIYATAGAPEKHEFLRRLGVTRLFSSRSTVFATAIREATGGEGVDCVLNSLAGEAAAAGIGLLRPFGRFIELGKRDFFADSPLRLRPFSNNLTYFGVDVDQLFLHQPELTRSLFAELLSMFAARSLMPLPHTVYPAERVADAFQTMRQSAHIGKLVISLEGAQGHARPASPPLRKLDLRPDAAYCITGGSSGLGLAAAKRLAGRGARYLLLLSRKGVRGEAEQAEVAALRASGVRVVDARVDVSDGPALEACLRRHLDDLPPLRGVIHAAAVLDDGLIGGLTPERIRHALAAKALGAWNLHRATLDLDAPLDFFALFSSISALFGNPGQAAYASANSMLETLAAWRRAKGLPAQVVAWGPVEDTGMLARNPKAKRILLQRLRIGPLESAEALDWLEHCLVEDLSGSAYFGLSEEALGDLPAMDAPRFSLLLPQRSGKRAEERFSLETLRAAGPEEGVRLLAGFLLEEISRILRLPGGSLAPDMPLSAQGMDSLMGVELALALEQRFDLTGYVPPLTDKSTARSLAQSLYPLLVGGQTEDSGRQGLLERISEEHGIRFSDAQREEMLETLTGGAHGE